MATQQARDRCRERIELLCRSGEDGEAVQRAVVGELRRVVGFDRWCLPHADPDSLLPGSGIADHDYGPGLPRALELEYSGADFAAKHEVARLPRQASSLGEETGGDLARSSRWDEVLRPVGIGDLAAVACRDATSCWGWLEAYRDSSERRFSEVDLELLAAAGPALSRPLRRTFVGPTGRPTAADTARPDAPGVLVLDAALRVVSRTPSAERWIAALPLADLFAVWGMLPAVIYPAATRARAGDQARAHARLATSDGRWVRVEAALLDGDRQGDIVVTILPAPRDEVVDLSSRAYGLTARETDVVRLLVGGADTAAIARRLSVSAWTVQDHLKSVFAKVGAHSRGEVVARLTGG